MYIQKSSRPLAYIIIGMSVLFVVAFAFLFSGTKTGNAQSPSPSPSGSGSPSPSPTNSNEPLPATTTPTIITGWAWSSTIGWISLNSNSGITPSASPSPSGSPSGSPSASPSPSGSGIPTIPYGVSMTQYGALSGWAWSSIIGWIDFNAADLTHCPIGSAGACAPRVNPSTGAVTGWIRACAATVDGDCQSADRNDGWDGWIQLSGLNHISPKADGTGGVTYNLVTGSFDGFAWGSDVVGWINFDANDVPNGNGGGGNPPGSSPCNPAYQVCGTTNPGGGPAPVTGSCTMSPSQLPNNGSYTTTATAGNVSGGNGSYGSYTFQWSDGSGFSGGYSSATTHSFTYPRSNGQGQNYTPLMQIQDSAGDTSSAISCTPSVHVGTSNNLPNLQMTLSTVVQPSNSQTLQGTQTLVVKQNSTAYGNIDGTHVSWSSFHPASGNTAYWMTQGFGQGLNGRTVNVHLDTSTVGDYSLYYTYTDSSGNNPGSGSVDLQVIPSGSIEER